MSCPCQQGVPLCHHPVQSSVEVYNDHGSDRRLRSNQGSVRRCGCDPLVNERHSKESSSKRSEEGKGRDSLSRSISGNRANAIDILAYILRLAIEANQRALAGVQVLGGGYGGGEERERAAQHFEARIYNGLSHV